MLLHGPQVGEKLEHVARLLQAGTAATSAHRTRGLSQMQVSATGGRALSYDSCPLRGDIRKNWNDTEKISMAPAQG